MQPTLLIVDDERTTREGLRAALEDRYDVYLAEDAKAAMDLLEREHLVPLRSAQQQAPVVRHAGASRAVTQADEVRINPSSRPRRSKGEAGTKRDLGRPM